MVLRFSREYGQKVLASHFSVSEGLVKEVLENVVTQKWDRCCSQPCCVIQ